jgi:hypothetical protein
MDGSPLFAGLLSAGAETASAACSGFKFSGLALAQAMAAKQMAKMHNCGEIK